MNLFNNLLLPQLLALFSLSTACGVFLHETHVDKALTLRTQPSVVDMAPDGQTKAKIGADPHTHAPHMAVNKDGHQIKALPRNRDRKFLSTKRLTVGHHDNGICMPLAGEWT